MEKPLPRLKFKCWQCHRIYSLKPANITEEQTLIVPCPFCDAEAVVKIEPFKRETKTVMRGAGEEEQSLGFKYDFPDVIPTQKPV